MKMKKLLLVVASGATLFASGCITDNFWVDRWGEVWNTATTTVVGDVVWNLLNPLI